MVWLEWNNLYAVSVILIAGACRNSDEGDLNGVNVTLPE